MISVLATAIIVYPNGETDKSLILSYNKGKAGIYQWTHKDSNKRYVDSAVDLSKRLSHYLNKSYLTKYKSMYIYKALLLHDYSLFSLTIFEYIDIFHLSKEDSRKLILEWKQLYIDSLVPEYNINSIAGSGLDSIQTEKTKEKLNQAMKDENNP